MNNPKSRISMNQQNCVLFQLVSTCKMITAHRYLFIAYNESIVCRHNVFAQNLCLSTTEQP